MQTKSKVKTYVGFAVRSNKYKIGTNAVDTLKRANLILICSSISLNGEKAAVKLANKFNCPILKVKEGLLSDYTFKAGGKVMAITDKDLSQAVIQNAENEFIQIER